jgi:hypothetical protein
MSDLQYQEYKTRELERDIRSVDPDDFAYVVNSLQKKMIIDAPDIFRIILRDERINKLNNIQVMPYLA